MSKLAVHRALRLLLAGAVAVVFSFVATATASAQAKAPALAASIERKETEEEATDSPRESMRRFIDLAERGRFQEASIYLDLTRGTEKRAVELTSQLYAVLSQRLLVDPETLSPLAEGRTGDGLPNGTEELGKITDAKGHPLAIRLVRRESKAVDDEARWVFSQSTVAAVPALYGALRDRWARERLPPSLLAQGPLALYYWQWLALPILAALCLAAGRVLSFLTEIVARKLLSKRGWCGRLVDGLKSPLTIGWSVAFFAIWTPYLALALRPDDVLDRCVRAVAYLTFFWALLRVVSVFGDEVAHAEWARTRPSARSLSSVGVSLGKVIVAALALMVALTELGYPVTSVIAGLGIGGVALALAAQKTVENLFGSLSILADQPFRVGDTIRIDTIEGAVESIGLRSTRVRTAERTLFICPNGKLADMRIESLGPRDRMRLFTKLQLTRGTTMAQIRSVTFEVKNALATHSLVRKEEISVRLTAIGEASYDIEIATALETLDGELFAKVREELLMKYVEIVEQAGAKIAVPARELVGASLTSTPTANGTPPARSGAVGTPS